jgi:hypothetical protein
MVGWRGLPYKEIRAVRRKNHIARDLQGSKYHQRVIPDKKKNKHWEQEEDDLNDE